MGEYLRVARLYLLLLALVTAGRWLLSFKNVPYETGTDKLSIFITTVFSSLFFAAFCRRWRHYSVVQAMTLGAIFGLMSQIVIFLSTAASYGFGLQTYFNTPRALNVEAAIPLGQALVRRSGGLVAGPIINAMVGLVGWAMGALLPADRA
jgi:hypothetical protein